MKVSVGKEPNSQVKLTVTIEADDLKKYEDLALKRIGEKISIKGFRKGKVPVSVVREHAGEEALKAEAIDIALPQTYAEAVEKEKLQVISRPKIDFKEPKEGDDTITYEAIVAVMPEVKVGKLDTIKIKSEKIEATDKDVQAVVDDIKKQNTSYDDADEKAKAENGDRVELDFDGFDDKGVPLDGTSSKNHPVVLGSNSFIPGFEENVLGMKKGEKKEFDITFPKDYFQESFQNKKVKFKIELKLIQKAKAPELNKELIKKLTGKDMDLDALKKDIKQGILDKKEMDEKRRKEVEFLDGIVKITKVDLPPQLVEEEIDFIIHDMKSDLDKKGLKYEDYLNYLKKTEEEHRGEYKDEATRRVTLRFALQEVYKTEKAEVTDKDVEEAIAEICSYYGEDKKEEVRKIYSDENSPQSKQLQNKLKLDKVLKKYLS